MKSTAADVESYLNALPADRRVAIAAVRDVIRANLDDDYEEGIQYGMIGYYVPHAVFPAGYHTDPTQPVPFAALGSQKNHMAVYLMGVYCGCAEGAAGETGDMKWFREAWAKTGKKLDMGKSCVRFKQVDHPALEVIGEAVRRIPAKTYIERYEATLAKPAKPAKAGKPTKPVKPVKRAAK